ncbi:MAG: hypothetical protein QXT26_06380 [Thermoproteota archaeon]
MILITTSHRPTRRVRSLCNDLARSIPGLIKVNRGKMGLIEVAEKAVQMDSDKFIVVDRWRGGPGRIRLFRITDEGFKECPPRLYTSGVKLRREFNIPPEWIKNKIKLLFIDRDDGEKLEIEEFRRALSEFFEIPILERGSEALGYDAYMVISAGKDSWATLSFFRLPSRIEIGPRIRILHVVWDV